MTKQPTNQQRVHRWVIWTTCAATRLACLLLVTGCASLHTQASPGAPPGASTYTVQYLPQVQIKLDGHLDEAHWSLASVESNFVFPWQERTAPRTDFRALCDDDHLYFVFCVVDADLFVLAELPEEGYAVF